VRTAAGDVRGAAAEMDPCVEEAVSRLQSAEYRGTANRLIAAWVTVKAALASAPGQGAGTYPTVYAYEQACKVLEEYRTRALKAEAELAALKSKPTPSPAPAAGVLPNDLRICLCALQLKRQGRSSLSNDIVWEQIGRWVDENPALLTPSPGGAGVRAETVEAIHRAMLLLSDGPYQWGVYDAASAADMLAKNLSFGSGDCHLVVLPKHPKSVVGEDPMRPEHAVTLCVTGNGPNSKYNAIALTDLLTALRNDPALARPSEPAPGGEVGT
jgi:hypothetical protein